MAQDNKAPSSSNAPPIHDGLFTLIAVLIGLAALRAIVHPWIIRAYRFYSAHRLPFTVGFNGILAVGISVGFSLLWNWFIEWREESFITAEDAESVCLGQETEKEKEVHLKAAFRTMHTQLIGTTNAGKTASVILPWAVRDMELGRGMIIVDGKSDRKFLDQIYAYAVSLGRKSDFLVFSLANPNVSSTFNPFCDGTAEQITERVFSAFTFSDDYYRNLQFEGLRTVISLLLRQRQVPTPGVIRELLLDKGKLQGWTKGLSDPNLASSVERMVAVDDEDFIKNYSGLVTSLGHFAMGETAPLYNSKHPEIVLSDVLRNNKICYFQLPTMQFSFLGQATGKLLLQSLQSAISEIQVGGGRLRSLFSVVLDDFNDYIYPGFVSLLNKSRSANVGVVFSHQSLGDLEKVSPDFKQILLGNTNIKIVMRSNDPESAEHFAKTIGTIAAEKTTARRKKWFFGHQETGEQSVRDVEEYVIHPNVFKSGLGVGQGIVILPHTRGTLVKRVNFSMVPELMPVRLPVRDFAEVDYSQDATPASVENASYRKAPRQSKPKETKPTLQAASEVQSGRSK
ncbi:MAG: type IV secretory system conjugative DNA transfer family protein [Bdellovibrionota bacterium]